MIGTDQPCRLCHGRRFVGIVRLPMTCPRCHGSGVMPLSQRNEEHLMAVTDPCTFARLCASIGYPDDDVVTTLVKRMGLDEARAREIVEQVYASYAARQAAEAAEHFSTPTSGN